MTKKLYEVRRKVLEAIIGDQKLTDFALSSGVSAPAISQFLSGGRTIGDQAAANLEKTLNLPEGTLTMPQLGDCNSAAVLENAPAIQKWRTVKIIGTAQMGENGFWCELHEGDGEVDIISTDPDAYALRVRGDSMSPAIRNNWIVWCEPNHELVSGEYVMVKTRDGQSMVKELLYANAIEISMMSINSDYARVTLPLEQIEQAHYVGGIVPPSKVRL